MELMKEIVSKQPVRLRTRSRPASRESLPSLFEAAEQVAFYANEFAQDKAVEQAGDYAHVANGIERLIRSYRNTRMRRGGGGHRFRSAPRPSRWWCGCCSGRWSAIVLIGPIGLATMHRVLQRLAAHHAGDDPACA